MRAFLPFLFLILYHAQKVRGKFCDEVEYTLINEIRRSTAYKSMSPYICDRGFIEDDKWYRFDSAAGNTMPTHNPGIRFCGAYVPIWLNGEHPTKENEEIDAKACAAVPFIPPTGCGISYNIKVVKCPGDFYLYRLKEPRQCSLAYCAGM
jgi:fibrillin 1